MISTSPQIGFDRFIQIDWVAAALRVRNRITSLDDLNGLLDDAGLGKEAKIKTRTKLNALVLDPRSDLSEFIDRGINLFTEAGSTQQDATCFAWGAALATYPYFGKVAEFTGRLTSIQGDCSVAEIHRRMSEVYGEREITKRATQAVLQTQANWGAIQRVEAGKRLARLASTSVADPIKISWLIEAALRYQGRPVGLATLQSTPVLYPFTFESPLAYVVCHSSELELRSEGPTQQFVALKATS